MTCFSPFPLDLCSERFMPLDEPEVIQDNPSVQSIVKNHLDYVLDLPSGPRMQASPPGWHYRKLVGNPYKPLFPTLTGGVDPKYLQKKTFQVDICNQALVVCVSRMLTPVRYGNLTKTKQPVAEDSGSVSIHICIFSKTNIGPISWCNWNTSSHEFTSIKNSLTVTPNKTCLKKKHVLCSKVQRKNVNFWNLFT